MNNKKNTSFTLIELLVVIVIIGVLAGVIMVTTSSSVSSATLARAKAFSSNMQNSMLLNLVSEWTFDEEAEGTTPATIKDSAGIHIGTVHGNPVIQTKENCVFGKCIYFDGSGDYVSVSSSSFIKNIDNITISFWFKNYTTGTSQGIISKIYGTKPYWSFWLSNGGSYVWEIADASSAYYRPSGSYKYSNDQWYYIVVTQEGSEYRIYLNSSAQLENNDIADFSETKSDSDLLIGYLTTSSYAFKGYIDDVKIYNAALSSSKIKQNYIAGLNSLLANGNISEEEYSQRINNLAHK